MLTTIFVVLVLSGLMALYVHDRRQTSHTILRNYPIVGYFRYFAETLGEYMRQYQYLPDWSERPFNRLERSWVYRSAKGVSNLRSFGSENVPPFIFRNAAFPILEEEKRPMGRQTDRHHRGRGRLSHALSGDEFLQHLRHEFWRAEPRRRLRFVARRETRRTSGWRPARAGCRRTTWRAARCDHADGHGEIRRA